MEEKNFFDISASAFCVNENDVFIVHSKMNAFFKYSISLMKMEFLGVIPNEPMKNTMAYSGIHYYENRLFFVPCWGANIQVYDLDKRVFSQVDDTQDIKKGRFMCSFKRNQYLFCVPFYGDYLYKIDMKTQRLVWKKQWKKKNYSENVYINAAFEKDNNIFMIVPELNQTILVLQDNEQVVEKKIEEVNDSFNCGTCINNIIYLYSKNSKKIYEFDGELRKKLKTFEMIKNKISILQQLNNKWLIQENGETGERLIYKKDRTIEDRSQIRQKNNEFYYEYCFGICNVQGAFSYYYDRRDNVLYLIDSEGKYKSYKMEIELEEFSDNYIKQWNKFGLIYETKVFDLNLFISNCN